MGILPEQFDSYYYFFVSELLVAANLFVFVQNTVCEACGDIGYKQLLLCCRGCKSCAVHQYVSIYLNYALFHYIKSYVALINGCSVGNNTFSPLFNKPRYHRVCVGGWGCLIFIQRFTSLIFPNQFKSRVDKQYESIPIFTFHWLINGHLEIIYT